MKYNLYFNTDLKQGIVENMRTYGGSFVQALAECLMRADRLNLIKLEDAFEVYIESYHPKRFTK